MHEGRGREGDATLNPICPFEVLELPPSFDLSEVLLENRFLELQLAHHPDRFVGAVGCDQAVVDRAACRFAHIVWAFEQLKNPLQRAFWIFQGAGKWPLPPPQASLLERILSLQEQQVEGLLSLPEREHLRDAAYGQLTQAFEAHDWDKAAESYMLVSSLRHIS